MFENRFSSHKSWKRNSVVIGSISESLFFNSGWSFPEGTIEIFLNELTLSIRFCAFDLEICGSCLSADCDGETLLSWRISSGSTSKTFRDLWYENRTHFTINVDFLLFGHRLLKPKSVWSMPEMGDFGVRNGLVGRMNDWESGDCQI
jgi:hypothetical protein